MIVKLLLMIVTLFSGRDVPDSQPICHSIQEDSVIYDCDYNGADNGWHPVKVSR